MQHYSLERPRLPYPAKRMNGVSCCLPFTVKRMNGGVICIRHYRTLRSVLESKSVRTTDGTTTVHSFTISHKIPWYRPSCVMPNSSKMDTHTHTHTHAHTHTHTHTVGHKNYCRHENTKVPGVSYESMGQKNYRLHENTKVPGVSYENMVDGTCVTVHSGQS